MKKLIGVIVSLAAVAPAARAAQPAALIPALLKQAPGLHSEALKLALEAKSRAAEEGLVRKKNLLTVIDYSLPSTEPRLFVFDLGARKLLFRELCAHGKNSGDNMANYFSNEPGSEATSLGLFVTADTYNGGNGYSLRLKGLEEGINDMAWDRMIVMHGAYYVSSEAIRALGRLGRSWGCPAIPVGAAKKIIDTIRGGSAVFAYYPERRWLVSSAFLH
jgi:hypothetical protein